MGERPLEILLVEGDEDLALLIENCLTETASARVTRVDCGVEALREELTTRHDVILLATDLADGAWPELVRELRLSSRSPLILMAAEPSVEDAVQGIRLGATDLLTKPFDLAEMSSAVRAAGDAAKAARRRRTRYRRLRRMTSRIIRERRDLRQRIDLICRDFVYAYRRLAQRVSETGLLSHQQQ